MRRNRRGDRFRIGKGTLMEETGHGRARKVGTQKRFELRRQGRHIVATPTRGGRPLVGREVEEPTERYYVWLLDDDDKPITGEGPYGPMTLEAAKYNARIGAEKGSHSRAVSRGLTPTAATFEVVRVYHRSR